MGKRYYCDFCDKSFADLPTNRRKHINGTLHQRMRKQHYDAFRDAESILAEEAQKIPCKQLLRTGVCSFGVNCRFSHLTVEGKAELERQILQRKEQERLYQQKQKKVTSSPSLEEWLEKRAKHPVKKVSTKVVFPQWSLPPNLRHVPNLPPSLLAPSMQDFNLDRIDWG